MKQPEHSHHSFAFCQSAEGAAMVMWFSAGQLKGTFEQAKQDEAHAGWKRTQEQNQPEARQG